MDYLVKNDLSQSSKTKKAERYGTQIITEDKEMTRQQRERVPDKLKDYSEQIQEDLRTILDGADEITIDRACQAVVDNLSAHD